MNEKKLLLVVDMQNDFIDGSLGTPEAEAIVPKVCEKIRNWDGRIWLTQDTHNENYLETNEGKHLPVSVQTDCDSEFRGMVFVVDGISEEELAHLEYT